LTTSQAEAVIGVIAGTEKYFDFEQSNVGKVIKAGLDTSEKVDIRFDPLIIRGFEYYTSTVFELKDTNPANPRSIAGGGRYDNLTALFGKTRIPGIGFGMGDVTLIDFLETHGIAPKPRIAPDIAMVLLDESGRKALKEIALDLRQNGLRVTTPLEPRKVGKQLERASKDGARFAVIVGGDELTRGAVVLRDLAKSTQEEVKRDRLPIVIHGTLESGT